MAEESKPKVKEKVYGLEELSLGLIFVAVLFLLRGIYYINLFLEIRELYAIITVLLAFYYLLTVIGIFSRRKFGYYIAFALVFLDLLFLGFYILAPILALIGIPLTIILFYFLWRNRDTFKEFDKIDRGICIGSLLLFILYLGLCWYTQAQPTPEGYYGMVSKEAIEKGDWKICEKLDGGYRDDCIRNFAVSTNNEDLCEKIKWDHLRSYCHEDIREKLEEEGEK